MIANQEVYLIFASLRPRVFAFLFFNSTQGRKGAKGVISIVMSFACVNTSLTHLQKSSVCGGAKYTMKGHRIPIHRKSGFTEMGREHTIATELLPPCRETRFQMDQSSQPEEKLQLGSVQSFSRV
ncbi:MAG: hypothetical protein C5S48_04040 [Candidatus Methanogaster sp.]|nr:MAG: hypothetical protein C5S48_04040 [ANME-2 cluster archaeon]